MAGEVYAEESANPLTRQLGPLQVWQWALVVVGGYFLYRILRGGSGSSSGSPVVVGGSAGDAGSGDLSGGTAEIVIDMQSKLAQQSEALQELTNLDKLQDQIIAGQNATITNLTKLANLQSQLDQALNKRIGLQATLSSLQVKLNHLQDLRRKCTTATCRTSYDKQIAAVQTSITSTNSQLKTIDTTITSLQGQIKGLTSVTVAPPNVTSANAGQTLTVGNQTGTVPTISTQQVNSQGLSV